MDTSDQFASKNCRLIANGLEEMWKVLHEMTEEKASELQELSALAKAQQMEIQDDSEFESD